MGSQKRPAHETPFINSHFPADAVDKTDGVTLEGAARDHDDAIRVPAMPAWVAGAETERIEKFERGVQFERDE